MCICNPTVHFFVTLPQGLSNYGPCDKSGNHIYVFFMAASTKTTVQELSQRLFGWKTTTTKLLVPLQKQFTELCSNFQRQLEAITQLQLEVLEAIIQEYSKTHNCTIQNTEFLVGEAKTKQNSFCHKMFSYKTCFLLTGIVKMGL